MSNHRIFDIDSMRTNRYDRHQKNLLTMLDGTGQATNEKIYVYINTDQMNHFARGEEEGTHEFE